MLSIKVNYQVVIPNSNSLPTTITCSANSANSGRQYNASAVALFSISQATITIDASSFSSSTFGSSFNVSFKFFLI